MRQIARTLDQKRVKIALLAGLAAGLVGAIGGPGPLAPATAHAQTASPGLPIPGFWDPKRRPERPDLRLTLIRFMSEVDYPPFNYAGPDGNPAGFNIDLARAICDELKIACTIQMRRFDTLVESLTENRGDAAIASIAVMPETRKKIDFSDPYYRPVARFAARRGAGLDTVLPERVEGKKIAVVAGTAHEAYLKALFTEAELKPYPTAEDARAALQKGEVDLLFGDGYGLAFWLNGADAGGCCTFVGGPFVESRYFGEGVGIAVKKGNDQLRMAMNWALFRLWEKGKFADLWLKYFPINPF
ncbi:transporter substrate-binding domain-containing protein [Rhodoplanes elegans]|uniref:transporter substrate-binding domain-containing protein n=1 Tax=Rhodoplanes elegans TaxID=29408 RepID=UPI001FD4402D|nr:transporter substrate-binding domain-containing protein [Rhodoplanes elegans]